MDAGLHLGAEESVNQPMPGQLSEPVKLRRDDGDTVMPTPGHRAGMTCVEMALVDDLHVNGVEPIGQLASNEIGHHRGAHGLIIASMAHSEERAGHA